MGPPAELAKGAPRPHRNVTSSTAETDRPAVHEAADYAATVLIAVTAVAVGLAGLALAGTWTRTGRYRREDETGPLPRHTWVLAATPLIVAALAVLVVAAVLRLLGSRSAVAAAPVFRLFQTGSAAAIALECGATLEQVAASLAAAGPASRHRMQVSTRGDGVTIINDAYNANPDSMAAGLKALAWMAREARSFAVLGEMAELGEDSISEHDRIGRLAVRLDVSRLIVVGSGRPMSAMLHGAVMEGSWGSEVTQVADADAALALLRDELQDGDVVLVKASNSAGLGALADALAADATGEGAR